jgi:hypothetical protein
MFGYDASRLIYPHGDGTPPLYIRPIHPASYDDRPTQEFLVRRLPQINDQYKIAARIFWFVTDHDNNYKSDRPSLTERHKRFVSFLQKATFPNFWTQSELDTSLEPITALEFGDSGVCGNAARTALAFFRAVDAGMSAQVIHGQLKPDGTVDSFNRGDLLNGHVALSVNYEGSEHYFDASIFGGGQIVTLPNGTIPSLGDIKTLARDGINPMDALPMSWRPSSHRPMCLIPGFYDTQKAKDYHRCTNGDISNDRTAHEEKWNKPNGTFALAGDAFRKMALSNECRQPRSFWPPDGENGPPGPSAYASWYYQPVQDTLASPTTGTTRYPEHPVRQSGGRYISEANRLSFHGSR